MFQSPPPHSRVHRSLLAAPLPAKTLFRAPKQAKLRYIVETGRRLRERFSEHLRSIRNGSRGFPVTEHFNSASHSLDDIMVCGLKQCSGGNISRKQREMRLIFKLGTLRPNGLNINFNFLWLRVHPVLHIRASIIWFSCRSTALFTLYFARALSVRASYQTLPIVMVRIFYNNSSFVICP